MPWNKVFQAFETAWNKYQAEIIYIPTTYSNIAKYSFYRYFYAEKEDKQSE